LNYFEVSTGRFYSFWADAKDNQQLSSNSASVIFIDNQNIVWIGTNSGGINKYDPNLPAFVHLKTNPQTTSINGFAEDKEGNFWIGTDGSGIDHYNIKTGEVYNISNNGKPDGLSSNGIVCLYTEKSGNLWIGTFGGGLNYYNVKENKFYHYIQGDKPENLSNNNIYSIVEDDDGKIWIGTLGGGLNVLNKETGEITRYNFKTGDETSLSSDFISCIAKDNNGDIWIGTFGGGINLFIKSTKTFRSFKDTYSNVSNNIISSIFPDSQGVLWIGTGGNGLSYFNRDNNSLASYKSRNSISSNFIKAINEDNQGNLWISTNNGLARLNTKSRTYENFDVHDGLQDFEFRERSTLKLKSGHLLFGGINGFNLFDPEKIVKNQRLPQVVITDFEIFNQPVQIGEKNSPLQADVSETKEIELSYNQSVFTIGFTALHYTLSEKSQYAYILTGFDQDWRSVGKERKATYTNLYPGTYYFKVKASNNDGIWNNNPAVLKIIILPPWWLTWWFYTLVLLSIIMVFFLIYQLRTRVLRSQQRVLKVEVEKRTKELYRSNEELIRQTNHMQELYNENKAQGEKLQLLYHEITDSIRAAREIQQSILPSSQFIKKYLPEYFIFYHPKDVVSGDFYWVNVKNNKIIIAAVDCTGHGVSGAFMSINGYHLLNQAVQPFRDVVASEILDRLNSSIKSELNYQDEDLILENGFDIGLCIIDNKKKTVEYSGAKHPLYILRGSEILELKGDKFSIGTGIFYKPKKAQKFTNYLVELKSDDVLYLFSDGYPDQIGGPKGTEKFLHTRFKELLISIGKDDMEVQRQILEKEFLKWKGENEQLDDVLVFGVKV
jgi:serine phosphatase RsbU (regulator of sigma subunit)/streptogramin lyase